MSRWSMNEMAEKVMPGLNLMVWQVHWPKPLLEIARSSVVLEGTSRSLVCRRTTTRAALWTPVRQNRGYGIARKRNRLSKLCWQKCARSRGRVHICQGSHLLWRRASLLRTPRQHRTYCGSWGRLSVSEGNSVWHFHAHQMPVPAILWSYRWRVKPIAILWNLH